MTSTNPEDTDPQDAHWVKIYSNIPKKEVGQHTTLILSGDSGAHRSVQIEHVADGRSSRSGQVRHRQRVNRDMHTQRDLHRPPGKATHSVRFKDALGNKYLDTIVEVDVNGGVGEDMALGTRTEEVCSDDSGILDELGQLAEVESVGTEFTYNSDMLGTHTTDSSALTMQQLWNAASRQTHLEQLSIKSLRTFDWVSSSLKHRQTHGVLPLLQVNLEGVPTSNIAQTFTRLYR